MFICLCGYKILLFILFQAPLEVICLIPELCYITGLTDVMRSDFKVMKVRRNLYNKTFVSKMKTAQLLGLFP